MYQTYKEALESGKLSIVLEPTTACTARCPQCHRTDDKCGGLPKIDWLPIVRWNLAEFKNAFPPHVLEKIGKLYICGTYGDANTCRDLPEMVEYYMENSVGKKICIDTNGATRDKFYWRKLGEIGKNRLQIVFDVDGINQEMHSLYRRGTTLSKVLENMRAFSEAGGRATTNTIVFKHNQDYLEDIALISKSYGAKFSRFTESNRNFKNGIYTFLDEDGETVIIEQMSQDFDYEHLNVKKKSVFNKALFPRDK
jgi:MoaA/NifB/PqqE/SkfB family radical SAM enzyme